MTINLYDVNDNSPVFPQAEYAANFREDANVGQTILERVLVGDTFTDTIIDTCITD